MRGTFATHCPTPQVFKGRIEEDHAEESKDIGEEETREEEAPSPDEEEEIDDSEDEVTDPPLSSLVAE